MSCGCAGVDWGGLLGAGSCAADVGCFDGFTSHASSSNPLCTFSLGGAEAKGVALDSGGGDLVLSLGCSKAFASTTSLTTRFDSGLPFRVLFRSVPSAPENKLLAEPFAPTVSPSPFSVALAFLRLEFFASRPYRLSKYFITRKISPSFTPRVRRTSGVISGRLPSSIESLFMF